MADAEIAKLKAEVAAKEDTLNQLKVKTKAFVDNMRNEMATEKKKVADLETQLKQAQASASSAPTSTASNAANLAEVESLKKELAAMTQRDNEFKARAKSFADNMKSQLAAEKDKSQKLEKELAETTNKLAVASASASSVASSASATSNAEIERLHSQLTNLQNQQQQDQRQFQQELARHQQDKNLLQQKHDEQISSLQETIANLQIHEQQVAANSEKERKQFVQQQLDALQNQIASLQQQLTASEQARKELLPYQEIAQQNDRKIMELTNQLSSLRNTNCVKCEKYQQELQEIRNLYDKVNMGRSRSDSQLAESQNALHELQQQFTAASSKVTLLTQTLAEKDNEITRLTTSLQQVEASASASRTDSFSKQQQVTELQNKLTELETKHQEMLVSMENYTKDNNEKRQKAKQLVVNLTNEKQLLTESQKELTKEVERLRMELNQRNLENDKRLKQMVDENAQKLTQSVASQQKLNDEIHTLKQTLQVLQENEKNQQKQRELATLKKDLDEANKKRMAAKAETQKLAVELENVQKTLHQLTDHTSTNCTGYLKKLSSLQERVAEALHGLEKRQAAAAASKRKLGASSSSSMTSSSSSYGSKDGKGSPTSPLSKNDRCGGKEDDDLDDVREAEFVNNETTSPRDKALSPSSGVKKVEETIAKVNDKLTLLIDVTERLCDLSSEQNDVTLKEVLLDRFTQLFGQCFSEKTAPAAYTHIDDENNSPTSRLRQTS